jgi:hypothetical protein
VRKLVVKESKLFNQELEQFVSSIRAGSENGAFTQIIICP